jgi:glycosyltransferase involved in cell wall biosynthesis
VVSFLIEKRKRRDCEIVYLGRSDLRRNRGNLLQVIQTVAALEEIGHPVKLYLPRRVGKLDVAEKIAKIAVRQPIHVQCSTLLHPKWTYLPFVLFHYRELSRAQVLYTRVPRISAALSTLALNHYLEIHDAASLVAGSLWKQVVRSYEAGILIKLIAISRSGAEILAKHGIARDRLHVAPSGVNLALFEGIPTFEPAQLENPRFVHIGHSNEARGLNILEAIAAHSGFRVTVVGRVDGNACSIEHVPTVPLTEVPSWYGKSDIILLPYQPELKYAETLSPVKLFEALASGRPIIAGNIPTIREILTHEHDALLVEPGDPQAWMAAIDHLRGDRSLARRISENAKRLAPTFSWQNRAKGIVRAIGIE